MMRSLYSGVSGLKNHQTRMDIIGNNIANVNTAGYKASRVVFQDIYSQTTKSASAPSDTALGGTNAKQVGLGVNLAAIDIIHSSAATQRTDGELDLALYGDGFFVVRSADGNLQYSRAGNLYVDVAGNLVNTSGCKMQGLQAATYVIKKPTYNADGTIKEPSTVLYEVAPPTGTAPTLATAEPDPADYTNGTDDTQYATDLDTYLTDLGTFAGQLEVYAKMQPDSSSALAAPTYNGAPAVTPGDPAYPDFLRDAATFIKQVEDYAKYVKTFVSTTRPPDYTGIAEPDPTDAAYPLGVNDPDYAIDMAQYQADQAAYRELLDDYRLWLNDPMNLKAANHADFLNADGTFNSDEYEVITGVMPSWFELKSTVDGADANNWTLVERSSTVYNGVLQENYFTNLNVAGFTGITFDEKGFIKGLDEGGNERIIGVLPIATFTNTGGLEKMGSSLYGMSANSGTPVYNQASTGGAGSVNSGGLEMSNVDLANEFTDMIITQRGYQASSRIITVSDTMLEELINLKR